MNWQLDALHTHVGFSVKHLMVSTVRGQFKQYRGTLELDAADFSRSRFTGEVDIQSIDTGNQQRDDHLRTSDFFDAANHPKILFKSGDIEAKGNGEYLVNGELTIRGVTQPIAFEVEYQGTSKNMRGKTVTGFSAKATINRKDFGVNYNALLETGGVAIGEKVKIEIEVEAVADEP
jgi:polyisoprenoid-binding protein YceI